jgi:hypothetical protein
MISSSPIENVTLCAYGIGFGSDSTKVHLHMIG